MRLNRWICVVAALVLLFSLLPTSVVAVGPALAQGNHEKWIDRIADLPYYARDFYSWLEANSGADGALANPSKGMRMGSNFVHQVHELKGSMTLDPTLSTGQIQNAIMDALNEESQEVIFYAFEVYGAFDRDHPEVFWLDTESICGMNLQYSINKQTGVVTYDLDVLFYLTGDDFDIRLACYRDPAVIAVAVSRREQDIARILKDCPTDASVGEQVRYLNRVLTQTNEYNEASAAGNDAAIFPTAWKCVSALAGSSGSNGPVCEGYARAFKVLCDRLGIPCVLTEGYAKGGASHPAQLHMWNYVCIDGSWYAVDVTWNDPKATGSDHQVNSGQENEKYLLIGSQSIVASGLTFAQSHQVQNGIHSGSLQYTNGPILAADGYEFEFVEKDPEHILPENYMDIAPYRSENGYTAPEKAGCVFTGWYADAALTVPLSADAATGYAYAGFVDEKVLSVKCQLSEGTTAQSKQTDLRILTGVSTLNLKGVVFHLNWEDTQIVGAGLYDQVHSGNAVNTASELFGQNTAYIMTCTVTNVPRERFGDILTITPGWYTLDGTFVTGTTRTVRISDGL